MALFTEAEKILWQRWNKKNQPPKFNAEQTLQWLDQMRMFMFEVWQQNSSLRRRWEKLNSKKNKIN